MFDRKRHFFIEGRSMKRVFIYLLHIALIFIFMTGCNQGGKSPASGNAESADAPDFTLIGLQRDTLRLSNFQGKIIILDFWDTWCPPCQKEIPDFVELYRTYQQKNVVIIGLALGREGEEKVKSFAAAQNISYPLAIADSTVLNAYGPIQGIPTTLIIDRNSKIVKRYIGFRAKNVFEKEIKALLDE
jgi:peroxiredoxin